MLNCRQVTALSSAHLDGEHKGRLGLQIRLHLMICRHCRRFKRHLDRSRQTAAAIARRLWKEDDEQVKKILQQLPKRPDQGPGDPP